MNKLFTRIFSLLLLCSLGISEIIAQPWIYDFGTGTSTANNTNSGSGNTSFFPGTPSGGGTYRIRIGGSGGSLILANTGTVFGPGTEAQLVASSGAATNKFSVYGWDSPSLVAYTKFKLRTTTSASGNGTFYIHLGNGAASTVFTDNNSGAAYTNSIAALVLTYSSGAISGVTRRNGGSNTAITTHGFLKNTNQDIEIYANNATTATTYYRDSVINLPAGSWDLYVGGTRISPIGGFARGTGFSTGNNLSGIAFAGESSTSNAAIMYIDDLEYSNALPSICATPTTALSGFVANSLASTNSIDLGWANGNGAGRVIYINTTNSFTNPSTGANPSANLTYGGSGQQVVYNGTGSGPVTVSGLNPSTTYYFKGYEYCSPNRVYNTSGTAESVTTTSGSTTITTTGASYGPFCNGTSHNITVGYTSSGSFIDNFKVQLSNENGVFSSNLADNIIGTGSSSPISATIPASITAGNYRVRVVNENPLTIGDNNGSNIVVNATPGTPTTPSPAAVCEGTVVTITGTGSANATGYTFWDASSGGTQVTSGVSGNTLTLNNATPAGTYTFYIQGDNGSCHSSRQTVTAVINAVPAAPAGTFTYSSNPSCGPATIGYDAGYFFQTTASGTSQSNPTSSAYTLNSSGTVYVRAFNGNCWSAAVASAAVTINPIPTIPTVATPASVCEGTAVSITGTGSTNATGYTFWDASSGGTQITTGVSGNTLTTPLSLGVGTHTYYVQGNSATCQSPRQAVNVVITSVSVSNVTSPSATASSSATVNWTNPSACWDEVMVVLTTTSGLTFSPSGNGSSYTANNVYSGSGNQVVYKGTGTTINVTGLFPGTTYYFEIYTRKGTTWSTGTEVSAIPTLNIPDNGCSSNTFAEYPIAMTGSGTVADVKVGVKITHPYRGDLRVYLVAPDNTEVLLINNVGTSADNLDVLIDQNSSTTLAGTNHTVDGTYDLTVAPSGTGVGSLNAFRGVNVNGTWKIKVCDSGVNDAGVINSGELIVTTCTGQNTVAFENTIPNTPQGNTFANLKVGIFCNGTIPVKGCNSGTVTLTFSGCGVSGTLTQPVVNGVADFSSLSVVRSLQNNVHFTAVYNGSCASNTPVVSNNFNITAPQPTTVTTYKDENFSSGTPTPWGYSVNVSLNNGGGSDVTGVINYGGNDYLRKTYSINGSSTGSITYIIFDDVTGLTANDSTILSFKVASNVELGSGTGNDSGEDLIAEISINDGAYSKILTHAGGSNKKFDFSSSSVRLAVNSNTTYAAASTQSAFSVFVPSGTNKFRLRFTAQNNRADESWAIDDLKVVGYSTNSLTSDSLPELTLLDTSYCTGATPIQITPGAKHIKSTATYLWSPSAGLSNASILNPTANPSSSTLYSLVVTDADGCKDTATMNVVIKLMPIITTQPVSISVAEDGTGAMSVVANNASTYRWQENDGSGWSDISGANTSVLTFTNPASSRNGNTFRVILTGDTSCGTVTSSIATLTVTPPACSVADPSGSFSYSANPSCGPATIEYTPGYYFQTSANGTSTSLPTSSPYTLNSTGTIYVRAYDGNCWSDASVASSVVTIRNAVAVSKQPQNKLVSSTGSGTMSVTATNVQSYQWQENDGSGWSNISGATTSVLTFTNPSQSKSGYTYRVIMTGISPCGPVTSSAATLTVATPSGPCNAPANLSANVAGGQVTFNWTGSEGADIHAILLTNVSTGQYSKGFSPRVSGFTAPIPSGTYQWKIISLCNTALFITENASQWITGNQFTVP